jgi:hypothetical protein
MDDAAETKLLKCAAVFVPELGPLVPAIVRVLDTAGKLEAILQPAVLRLEAGEHALLELAAAAPEINDLLPEMSAAFAVLAKVRAIAAKYEAALEQAAS